MAEQDQTSPSAEGKKGPSPLWKMAHMGFEFGLAIVLLAGLGWWIDRKLGSEPKGVLIFGTIGLIGGTYLFLKEALKAQRQAAREIEAKKNRFKSSDAEKQDNNTPEPPSA